MSQVYADPCVTKPESKDHVWPNLLKAVYPSCCTSENRMLSFVLYPVHHKQPITDLVRLGFFSAGYSDCLRCFYCGLGLKYWRAEDDAAVQHIVNRPFCKYILWVLGRDFVERTLRLKSSKIVEDIVSTNQTVRSLITTSFCTGREATLGVIRLMVNSEPISTKSLRDAVQAVIEENERQAVLNNDDLFPEDAFDDVGDKVSNLPVSDFLKMLEEETNYYMRKLTCMVCRVNRSNIVHLPCGHICTCKTCNSNLTNCPSCDKYIYAVTDCIIA